ncbi:hypothetical protein MMU07_12450 [Aquiflexum sp. LQ15W]|uniref:hypothetical protein n=1 Tax=Cognataquiflexum nitidum TaxID=2922272 RepID=UPI001F141478|nr:hypothetical protein [Cognataquiflexum nitidum]MCH6200392.1 hypothetical protein [Cognataquiflexum nitidum]
MIKNRIAILLIWVVICSCSEREKGAHNTDDSNEWELVILDSIQVDYLGNIREGIFNNGIGLVKDMVSGALIRFDSMGNILTTKEFPLEGPGSISFLETLVEHNGEFFGTTSAKNIYHFDADLNLKERLEMPILGEARGGAYNRRNIAFWEEKILLWYPGRNGVSPYIDHFYRDYPLLELYDLKTKTSSPVVRTPSTSKFSGDDFFNRPDLNFTIENDSLYLTFSNEPILHIYALGDSILWKRSMDINPIDFKLMPGQKTPVTYQEMTKMFEANIQGIFSDSNHIIVTYHGGIDSDTFAKNNLKERENFYLYPHFVKNYLKIYWYGYGWSNEVMLPSKIDFILNIESVDKPFYALRDDDFLGEEQNHITFYKLKLVKK